ncbi:GSCFA domain-containing protein [Flavisericum labens]|uniref:GSCFA domain-containing protein n=1 Tax=Flavisericum labens TaxID=3377112 RepID=UPI00387B011E
MKLQTQIPLNKQPHNLIDYQSNMLLLGSCFSDNIGKKLNYFKFKNLQNPFGILFQPKAIETLVEKAVNNYNYSEQDVFFHNERWHCFDAHSKLSEVSKEDLLHQLNSKIKSTHEQIKNASHIVITIGTAWVYRFLESDILVANCHKVPQKQFKKELLSVEEIFTSVKNIINLINEVNPKSAIIFTVSPVRHLKDGFVENTQSKAHLISAIQKVILDAKGLYFPSYEIMMDELRDYRFYEADMIHPNQTAINYIWERFQQVWMSSDSFKTMEEVDTIQKGLLHKPFNPNSEAHLQFLQGLEVKTKQLKSQFPDIVF